jgi:hypothetical protein
VLEDLHTCQSLGALQFTSDDPDFVKLIVECVYPLIPSTTTAPEMPPTRAFSRQLIAYIAVFLPVAPYFRSNDSRISGVCDDQYTATLERLEETCDEAFKLYLTRKTQGAGRQRLAVITNLALGDVAIAAPWQGVGHTPSKTSRVQSAAFRSSLMSSSTPRLCQAPLACAIGYTHIEIICWQNCVNVGIDCDIIGEIIGEIMDVIVCDIIGL